MPLSLPKNATPAELQTALTAVEARLVVVEDRVKKNTDALRAILTILHPDPDHPEPTQPVAKWAHGLIMTWLAELGGRVSQPS